MRIIVQVGQRFTRLVVLGFVWGYRKSGKKFQLCVCRCDCGNIHKVSKYKLAGNAIKSCGCLLAELRLLGRPKHGGRRKPEYRIYAHMKGRCKDLNCEGYGGRGIKVCERWLESFVNFYADMGPRPTPKHTIERIDNDGDYEPGNCIWATRLTQNKNTRRSMKLTYNGQTKTASEWADDVGMPRYTLYYRINAGWPVGLAITTPSGSLYRNAKLKELLA